VFALSCPLSVSSSLCAQNSPPVVRHDYPDWVSLDYDLQLSDLQNVRNPIGFNTRTVPTDGSCGPYSFLLSYQVLVNLPRDDAGFLAECKLIQCRL
jgi:hypothetical protein